MTERSSQSRSARLPETNGIHRIERLVGTALLVLFTEGCDLKCIFCRAPQPHLTARTASLAEIRALVCELTDASRLIITGGEPTFRQDLTDICLAAGACGYREIQLQTHGGRLAIPGYAARLRQAGITALELPIYGTDPSLHDAITGVSGSFHACLSGAQTAREEGIALAVHVTVMRSNLDQIASIADLAVSLGATDVLFEPIARIDSRESYLDTVVPLRSFVDGVESVVAQRPGQTRFRLSAVPACALTPAMLARAEALLGPGPPVGAVALGFTEAMDAISPGWLRGISLSCDACCHRTQCLGVHFEYLRALGENAVPVRCRS